MSSTQEFRSASADDLPHIINLLQNSDLPIDGVQSLIDSFLVAMCDDEMVGCAGLERYGEWALLRSVAVDEQRRGTGLGRKLVLHMIEMAEKEGIHGLVLLTTTADRFFERLGFVRIDRSDAPVSVQASAEFQTICPSSAIVMKLDNFEQVRL